MDTQRTHSFLGARSDRVLTVALLISVMISVGLIAAACSFPRLIPVQADRGTPVSALPTTAAAAAIEIAPTQGGPGSRITVTGRGWQPGDTVFVRLEDPETGATPGLDQASAIVSEAGEFSVKFTYPNDPRWSGLPRVSIVASDPTQGVRASAQFTLAGAALPTLTATGLPIAASPTPTATEAALTATSLPATATRVPPTSTRVPPTATSTPTKTPAPPTATPQPTATPVVITHWSGEYYANLGLSGQPVLVRDDWGVDFSWGSGSPASGVPANGFSARWTRALNFAPGIYRFYVTVDDGARLWVDDQLLIDEWHDSSTMEPYSAVLELAGTHRVVVEYYEHTGRAFVSFWWERVSALPGPNPRPGLPTPGKKLTPPLPIPMPQTATPAPLPTAQITPGSRTGVRLNELLPVPGRVDWDGNKRVTAQDEWIEIANPTRQMVDVSGWTLEVSGGRGARRTFRLPQRTTLPAGGFLVFFDRQTRLAMDDTGGLVNLYDAAGKLVDTVRYGVLKPDSSYGLGADGIWRANLQPSPGKANPASAAPKLKPTAAP